jgi:hypothetical protein
MNLKSNLKHFSVAVLVSVAVSAAFTAAASAASLPATPSDIEVVQNLAAVLAPCVEQPVSVDVRSGKKSHGALRSHCDSVTIEEDRVQLSYLGRSYTLLVRDSELSDGGDLSDLFVQYDSREDLEVLVASNLLTYSDPALSALLVSGYRAEDLPEVSE